MRHVHIPGTSCQSPLATICRILRSFACTCVLTLLQEQAFTSAVSYDFDERSKKMRINLWPGRRSIGTKSPFIEIAVSSDGPRVVASLLSNAAASAKEGIVLERTALELSLEVVSLEALMNQAKCIVARAKLFKLAELLSNVATTLLFVELEIIDKIDYLQLRVGASDVGTIGTVDGGEGPHAFVVSMTVETDSGGRRRRAEDELNANRGRWDLILEAFLNPSTPERELKRIKT